VKGGSPVCIMKSETRRSYHIGRAADLPAFANQEIIGGGALSSKKFSGEEKVQGDNVFFTGRKDE